MTITAEMRYAFHEFDAKLATEYRAELVAGEIIVNPPPLGDHEYVIMRLIGQLSRLSSVEVGISGHRGIATPHGNFVPDLTVVDDPEVVAGQPSWGTTAGILLLVEITSSEATTDREDKRLAYAAAGIPLYLLIDRSQRESVLFSLPDVEAQDYQADIRVPFGEGLPLPAPFDFTLTDFTPRA